MTFYKKACEQSLQTVKELLKSCKDPVLQDEYARLSKLCGGISSVVHATSLNSQIKDFANRLKYCTSNKEILIIQESYGEESRELESENAALKEAMNTSKSKLLAELNKSKNETTAAERATKNLANEMKQANNTAAQHSAKMTVLEVKLQRITTELAESVKSGTVSNATISKLENEKKKCEDKLAEKEVRYATEFTAVKDMAVEHLGLTESRAMTVVEPPTIKQVPPHKRDEGKHDTDAEELVVAYPKEFVLKSTDPVYNKLMANPNVFAILNIDNALNNENDYIQPDQVTAVIAIYNIYKENVNTNDIELSKEQLDRIENVVKKFKDNRVGLLNGVSGKLLKIKFNTTFTKLVNNNGSNILKYKRSITKVVDDGINVGIESGLTDVYEPTGRPNKGPNSQSMTGGSLGEPPLDINMIAMEFHAVSNAARGQVLSRFKTFRKKVDNYFSSSGGFFGLFATSKPAVAEPVAAAVAEPVADTTEKKSLKFCSDFQQLFDTTGMDSAAGLSEREVGMLVNSPSISAYVSFICDRLSEGASKDEIMTYVTRLGCTLDTIINDDNAAEFADCSDAGMVEKAASLVVDTSAEVVGGVVDSATGMVAIVGGIVFGGCGWLRRNASIILMVLSLMLLMYLLYIMVPGVAMGGPELFNGREVFSDGDPYSTNFANNNPYRNYDYYVKR